ncbi:ribbon-helix-helix protein, CopG family [Allofournierella sp.]|uniref:ribbon-helix-helix protein, CopG family n=1 Tax=Allofournierella sp. TaxID=1940256 RepID=UPI003AB778CC
MDRFKISKKAKPAMLTIRIDLSIMEFYEELARKTDRSRNEVIALALEYAKDQLLIEEK